MRKFGDCVAGHGRSLLAGVLFAVTVCIIVVAESTAKISGLSDSPIQRSVFDGNDTVLRLAGASTVALLIGAAAAWYRSRQRCLILSRAVAEAGHRIRSSNQELETIAALMDARLLASSPRTPPVVPDPQVRAALRRDIAAMLDIANDLLLAPTLQADAAPDEPVNAARIIGGMVDDLQPLAARSGVKLTFLSWSQPRVRIGAPMLRRIVAALVAASLRSTPSGGQISILVSVTGQNLRISLGDTGHGILAPDAMGVEPLLPVYDLAERYGGTVRVADTGRYGCVITLSLPGA